MSAAREICVGVSRIFHSDAQMLEYAMEITVTITNTVFINTAINQAAYLYNRKADDDF
ncbi:16869_t:CDS:2 [Dentiscutata heterogama]|uniref:16869_t:CDS:1 n=1 Tax=Dentiscutata heterogama TaxID=1316150 RepID=A0ACA9K329_9GLOM|nr:16869_t:CDS:2 [Dentiscutata heterogama]